MDFYRLTRIQLKARLLAAHQLTDYQRVEQIFQLPPLATQKPSELLAEMLRLCPRGQENSLFFTYLFLHRLPRELRVLLTDVDHNDRRLLSERADQLWAHYAKHSHSMMACIEGASSDEDIGAVAAIRRQGPGGKPSGGKARLRKGGSAPGGGGCFRGQQAAAAAPAPAGRRRLVVLVPSHLRGPGQRLQAALSVDDGKLASRGRLTAIASGRLVHVSKRQFLCDTIASYSVFPFRSTEPPSGPSLTGPDGQRILCWGEKEMSLSFHGVTFTWMFLLAEVQFPILGIDFLRHYRLVVDAAGGQLVDTRSMRAFPAASRAPQRTGEKVVFSCIGGTPPLYRQLLVD